MRAAFRSVDPIHADHRYHETLCSVTMVIVQHPTESRAPLNRSCVSEVIPVRFDESVAQALVIAFLVIVGDEILNGCPQRSFTEQDHSIQARFLYSSNKSLCVGVQIGRTRRLFY